MNRLSERRGILLFTRPEWDLKSRCEKRETALDNWVWVLPARERNGPTAICLIAGVRFLPYQPVYLEGGENEAENGDAETDSVFEHIDLRIESQAVGLGFGG